MCKDSNKGRSNESYLHNTLTNHLKERQATEALISQVSRFQSREVYPITQEEKACL